MIAKGFVNGSTINDSRPVLPSGFMAGGVHCGIRHKKVKLDLGLVVAERAYPAVALFTQNRLTGVHVGVSRASLERSGGRVRALLVNSGNANCSTGDEGVQDALQIRGACADIIGCPAEEVLFLSTGVIGTRLPVELILGALPQLAASVSVNGLGEFAQAIMTTDLVPKVRTRAVENHTGPPFRVTGVAKGSGMIHPNLATMFGFLLTDAPAPHCPLEELRYIASKSFNRLTVDGDTSTNDTVILWCSERAPIATPAGRPSRAFIPWNGAQDEALKSSLLRVSRELCRAIAADGEGATRLVTVQVSGAPSEICAVQVGRVIATSPLTKTAVHGRDPNWGRILAAAGRAGVCFDVNRACVWIGDAVVYENGRPHEENEPAAHLHLLSNQEVILGIDLAAGDASAEVWTCDFSADYVRINADYRS